MDTDRRIQEAVAAGEKNKSTSELIHNWCSHARVEKMGGVGLVEIETGLPIGHHAMACDHAPAGGMATWDLAEAALDFHDRNCVDCKHRKVVGLPNLTALLEKRTRLVAQEEARQTLAAEIAAKKLSERHGTRQALRSNLTAPSTTVIDDLAKLDIDRSSETRTKLVETAKLAPEVFTPAIIEHFYSLIENGEHWFCETGLQILRQLRCDEARLTRCAMLSLAKHDAVETAANILEKNINHVDEALIHGALSSLILLASPPHYSFSFQQRTSRPSPLLALYTKYPTQVSSGIEKLLAEKRVFTVSTGARAVKVLATKDPSAPLHHMRSLASKLAHAHLLFDADDDRNDLDDVFYQIQDALALAFESSPEETDAILLGYFKGASRDGEARLIGVYGRFLSHSRQNEQSILSKLAYKVALKSLIWAATTSKNEEVLRNIQHCFSGTPNEIDAVAREELDILLGAAVIIDDRLNEYDASHPQATDFLGEMERQNHRSTLRNLQEGFIQWGASAASGNEAATESFINFLERIDRKHDWLRSAFISQVHRFIGTTHGLNAVLPTLYSAMVGPSQLERSAAANTLEQLKYRQMENLPELVFEALTALLRDPYVIVHQSAVGAVHRLIIPEKFDADIKQALLHLILAYRGGKARERFLMECIEIYVKKYLDDDALANEWGQILLALMMELQPSTVVHNSRYLARQLRHIPGYIKLVLHVMSKIESITNYKEDAVELLQEVLPSEVFSNRREVEKLGIQWAHDRQITCSIIEVLTHSGAWNEAQKVAQAAWENISDTTRNHQIKWMANLDKVATSFEAAIAEGRLDDLPKMGQEWRTICAAIENDRVQYEEKRDPLRGLLRPHKGG